jgi:peptide chain release factor subunit 1
MVWPFLSDESKSKTESIFDEVCILSPPKPIRKTEYFCDKRFHVDSVIDLYSTPELCGIIWINGQDTSIFTLDMSSVSSLKKVDNVSTRLKKHNKGGSSSARFGRLHKEAIVHYLKKVVEESITAFSSVNYLVIVGIGERKDELISYFPNSLKDKLLGVIVSENLDKALSKVEELYLLKKRSEEETYLSYFLHELDKDTGKAVYGPEIVMTALKDGLLCKMYINSEDIPQKDIDIYTSICLATGCEVLVLKHSTFNKYGSVFGILWY